MSALRALRLLWNFLVDLVSPEGGTLDSTSLTFSLREAGYEPRAPLDGDPNLPEWARPRKGVWKTWRR